MKIITVKNLSIQFDSEDDSNIQQKARNVLYAVNLALRRSSTFIEDAQIMKVNALSINDIEVTEDEEDVDLEQPSYPVDDSYPERACYPLHDKKKGT